MVSKSSDRQTSAQCAVVSHHDPVGLLVIGATTDRANDLDANKRCRTTARLPERS
jgi:hypothetical protein